MAYRPHVLLEPRKSPVQARSTASVDAILEATIQVLISAGKDRLTTTRVASRAGVSVGTLYQYFPNKSALLKAVLQRHLEAVGAAVERVCTEQQGRGLREMATALVTAFLQAKMNDAKISVALYAIAADLGRVTLIQQIADRSVTAVAAMLASSCQTLTKEPRLIASMLHSAMAGVSRRMLDSGAPEVHYESFRQELVFFVCAYVDACCASLPLAVPEADEASSQRNAPSLLHPATRLS